MNREHLALCGHEVGHASLLYWRREGLHNTSIQVSADGGGTFHRRCGSSNVTELMVKVAGPLVQCLMLGVTPKKAIRFADEYKNPHSDTSIIRDIVRAHCNGVDSRKFQFEVQEKTRSIVQHPAMWCAINEAAEKLYKTNSIDGEELEAILDRHNVPTLFDSPATVEWVQRSRWQRL